MAGHSDIPTGRHCITLHAAWFASPRTSTRLR
jgi:hypothetical protein